MNNWQGVQRRMVFGQFLPIFEHIFVFVVVTYIFDLAHGVEAIFHLPYVLTASINLL